MRLFLRSSGGFAGLGLEGEIDTSELQAELATSLERLLTPESLEAALHDENPLVADALVYDLTVYPEKEGASPREYRLTRAGTDPEVIEALSALIKEIVRKNIARRKKEEKEANG